MSCLAEGCEIPYLYGSKYCRTHTCKICNSYNDNPTNPMCYLHRCDVIECTGIRSYWGRFCCYHKCKSRISTRGFNCYNRATNLSKYCEACLSDDPGHFYKKCLVEGCKNTPVIRTQVCSIHKCHNCDGMTSPELLYCYRCKCRICDKLRATCRNVCVLHNVV